MSIFDLGDKVTYVRSGDFGGPCTYHHATLLKQTLHRCKILLTTGRTRYVKPTSLVKGWKEKPRYSNLVCK